MTATVRSVDVKLRADVDAYIARMTAAGKATDGAFDRAQVGAKNTTRELAGTEKQLGAVDARAVALGRDMRGLERDTRSVDRSINQLTGRLRLFADLAAILGPGAVTLGAGGVAGLVALVSQLGAAATGAGVAYLAVAGLGDGLKALNEYQLEPTQANLEKLNEEWRKAGPAGREFLLYLDSIEPKLRSLQMAARAGLLPGAEEGIAELMTALPEVRRYIRQVAETMGDLAADAGADLVGDGWEPFFDYVRSDGIELLDQLARATGNVAQGTANMLAGFGPVTGDFSAGLLELTERYADWSEGLDDNADFQAFVDYLRRNGPAVVDFLGSFATTLGDVAEASAPIGEVTLPLLTGLVDVLGVLASSNVGTPLVATAAALALVSRASAGLAAVGKSNVLQTNFVKPIRDLRTAAPTLGQLGTYLYRAGQSADHASKRTLAARESVRGFARETAGLGRGAALLGGIAVAATGAADGLGLSNTATLALMGTIAGPWGAAVGGGIGLAMDLAAANRDVEEAVTAANDAMDSMSVDSIERELDNITTKIAQVEDDLRTDSFGEFFQNMFDPDVISDFTRDAFGMDTQLDKLRKTQDDLRDSLAQGGSALRQLLAVPSGLEREFDAATRSVDEFAASFADLQSLLDRSGSLVNYERAIDDLAASMKESGSFNAGFENGRKNIEGLNDVVARAIERSQALKEAGDELGAVRILRRARQDLLEFGEGNEGAMRKIRPLVKELDNLSAARPRPKIDADTRDLDSKVTRSQRRLDLLQQLTTTASIGGDVQGLLASMSRAERALLGITRKEWRAIVRGDIGDALSAINSVRGAAENAAGTYTVRIRTVREGSGFGPQRGAADGATVPKTGRGYADRHLYLLADGEEVVSNRHGQADRHRGLLKDISAGRLAEGGTTGPSKRDLVDRAYGRFNVSADLGADDVRRELSDLRDALRDAKRPWTDAMQDQARALTKTARMYDRLNDSLEKTREAQASYRDEVAGSFNNDIFGNGLAGLRTQLEADRNDSQTMLRVLKQAERRGLDGDLAKALYASGDLTTAQQIAKLTPAQIAQLEKLYEQRANAQQALGNFAAQDVYGPTIAKLEQQLRRQDRIFQRELREFLGDRAARAIGQAVFEFAKQAEAGRNRAGAQYARAGG